MTVQGDVVLIEMRSVGTLETKLRPALVLASLPGPWQHWLACGISASPRDVVPDWDEVIAPTEERFKAMGLKRRSVIRLSFLVAIVDADIAGRIGAVPKHDLVQLRKRLAASLTS